ncbi:MAG: DUF4214 domain-containing protein [Simplicispira sp.]|uniref:DUF4214 domain-containing protein n=1 Tax=Simplicispira sp. TaxID=2015802 RepID=UPI002587BD57|nr:DUF4214 domain-containing protein [Simplicispira sp.]MDD2690269.1 DUF4214 domain-containing protein [Simplicispira sp.]
MPSANALTTIQKLYIAYYGRAADAAGQNYWATEMDNAGGSLNGIIDAFATAPEAQALYGSGTTVNERITVLYQNILGRAPEADGLAYWAGEVAAGRLSLGNAALSILNGVPPNSTDAALVNNRLAVANTFTAQVNDQNYGGDAAAAIARTFLKQVTGDAATLTEANNQLPAYLNTMGVATRQPDKFAPLIANGLLTNTAIVRTDLTDDNLDAILGAGNAQKAPWTLLVTGGFDQSAKILISDGTAAGTDVKANSGFYGYTKWMVNSDKTGAYFFSFNSEVDMVGYSDGTLVGTQSIAINQPLYASFSTLVNDQLILAGSAQGGNSGKAYVINGMEKKSTSTDMDFAIPPFGGAHDVSHQAVWFGAHSSPYGYELARFDYSNPSQMSSTLVKDIYPGASGGLQSINEAVVLPNGKLIFSADDGTNGQEAWVSNGTEAGTFMLKNYYQGNTGDVGGFRPYGNKVAFVAIAYNWGANGDIPQAGTELAFTDGTSAGTTLLDINPGSASSYPSILGEANGRLYFTAEISNPSSGATQKGIYSTNGTTFTKLATINNEASLLGWDATKAFFKVSDAQHGAELWAADFGKNTFGLVKDLLPGSGAGFGDTTNANSVQLAGGKLIFKAYTSATKQGLFVSDGTTAGTVNVGTANATTDSGTNRDFKVVGDTLVFNNAEGVFAVNLGAAIPKAVQLSTVGITTFYNSYTDPAPLQTDADQAFFLTSNGDLFASKGTTVPTAPLVSQVQQFKVVAENALFIQTANTATNTQSLWYSDGTAAGTRFIEDLPNSDYGLSSISFDLKNAVAIKTVGVVA